MQPNRSSPFRLSHGMPRRDFLRLIGGFAAGLATADMLSAKSLDLSQIPLGLCNHSLRGMRWKATQLLDYAAGLKLDGLLLNSLDNFENLEQAHLQNLKKKADADGIRF